MAARRRSTSGSAGLGISTRWPFPAFARALVRPRSTEVAIAGSRPGSANPAIKPCACGRSLAARASLDRAIRTCASTSSACARLRRPGGRGCAKRECLGCLAQALFFAGELDEARRVAVQVVERPDAPGVPDGYLESLGLLALIDGEQGGPRARRRGSAGNRLCAPSISKRTRGSRHRRTSGWRSRAPRRRAWTTPSARRCAASVCGALHNPPWGTCTRCSYSPRSGWRDRDWRGVPVTSSASHVPSLSFRTPGGSRRSPRRSSSRSWRLELAPAAANL
jgi:hypothetical protein